MAIEDKKSVEYPNLVTTLPTELNTGHYLPRVMKGVSQWSRVTAWLWTDCLAYAGDPEKAWAWGGQRG